MGHPATNTVFRPAPNVVVRRQRGQFLFYNSRTDELHLVPSDGYDVFCRCDGTRTVEEIIRELSPLFDASQSDVDSGVHQFLGALESRGILEQANA